MNSARTHLASAALLVLVGSACADADPAPETEATAAADSWDAVADAAARDYAIGGLEGPEAVKYDPEQDVWFISNFGPNDEEEANDGYIARANAETGVVETLRWAVGPDETPLQEPRGMALSGDTLWVADARGLHAFSRTSGAHLRFVDLTALEPGFLNDVAVAPDGTVYVTDTGRSRLVRLTADGGEIVLEGDRVGSPNGITWDPARQAFVLVPWAAGGDSLRAWAPGEADVRIVARSPGARFDGVEALDGALVVASQGDSALHVVVADAGRAFRKVPGRPADIALDTRRRRVAVPYIALDRVDVYALPAGPPGN